LTGGPLGVPFTVRGEGGMQSGIKSLAEYIEDVAMRTGAPADFIEKVGFIFSSKGIALSENAEPYAAVVEETFLIDETLRMSETRTLECLDLIAHDVDLARGYLRQQVDKLMCVEESMDGIFHRNAVREGSVPACDSLVRAARSGNVYIFPGTRQSH
jgi:hypothetical protein